MTNYSEEYRFSYRRFLVRNGATEAEAEAKEKALSEDDLVMWVSTQPVHYGEIMTPSRFAKSLLKAMAGYRESNPVLVTVGNPALKNYWMETA